MEPWQHLVEEAGLANATRLIMAEHPGRGDSVKELDGLWEDLSVFQICEAILRDRSPRPTTSKTIEFWGQVRAGANATISLPTPIVASPAVSCNSWLDL
jgi:hypothetical protein